VAMPQPNRIRAWPATRGDAIRVFHRMKQMKANWGPKQTKGARWCAGHVVAVALEQHRPWHRTGY
jgi:hypothetical protein